jgi:rSAM/selenodomain-associated transferase 1
MVGKAATGDVQASCAVAIMAKASHSGFVKTRLVPPLTPHEAAEINTCFLADIAANISTAAEEAPIHGYAAYHPIGSESFFHDLLPAGFLLLPPREAGLGRSLFHAARDLLNEGFAAVCLVNSDSPTLPTRFLIHAARALLAPGDRVILGPCTDGGYYLIGLKVFHARLFEDIAWSTERVLEQTKARAGELGLEVAELPEWYDVDDGDLLARLGRELLLGGTEPERGYSAWHSVTWLRQAIERAGGERFGLNLQACGASA